MGVTDSLFNSLPNDKILNQSKLKVVADNKIIVTQRLKFVFGRIENMVGKGENAGYQHFLLFPQCFQKLSFQRCLKPGLCGNGFRLPVLGKRTSSYCQRHVSALSCQIFDIL